MPTDLCAGIDNVIMLVIDNVLLSGYATLFIHSSIEGHFGGFQILAVTSKSAIDMCV